MPLIIKDFSWNQTPTTISIVVPITGLKAKKTDIITSNNYVRFHCHHSTFEAFLYSEVDDEKGSCIIDTEKGTVHLNFPKLEETSWPFLEAQGLDRFLKKVLRDKAVETSHQRHQKKAQDISILKDENRKFSVQEQMLMDQEQREKVAAIKKKEVDLSLADVRTWTEKKENKDNPCVSSIKKKAESNSTISSIWPEGCNSGGGDAGGVGIRQPQKITVQFTPRDFLTPARESSAHLEEEWLKKQAEARRLSGFNEPDLSPEERDPDWLLEKGISLMRTDCHLGAVSAFCLAIKLAPKMPELYMERGKAHLLLRNFVKSVDDSSLALDFLTPKVAANAGDRLKCHVNRADAFQALQMYSEAYLDLQEALKLNPEDEKLKQRVQEVRELVDIETAADSDCSECD
jgi:dyslexia susceptibility 1 candidate gene 1 protein